MLYIDVLTRELQIYWRSKTDLLNSFIVCIIIVAIVPLVTGRLAENQLWVVPCLIWTAALITNILSQEHLLRNDYNLGIFEQLLISKCSLYIVSLAKITAHWIAVGLPLILTVPLLGILCDLPFQTSMILCCSMILGTPALSLIGATVAALTVSLNNGAVLLMLLLLPLYVPILVLGASAGILNLQGMPCSAQLALLAAFSLLALMFAPFATSVAIRINTA